MTLSNTPLAIDGALTSSSLLRKGLKVAIGSGGVFGANDYLVAPNSPAGQSLLIGGGLAAVPNGYQTTPDELYVVPNPSTHTVTSGDMPPSNPSLSYYLVCIVVGDPDYDQTGHPFMPSSFDTSLATTFDYDRIVVLPCTSTTTTFEQLGKHYPGLALARLAVPATTTTITSGMITDLRSFVHSSSRALAHANHQDMNIGTVVPNNTGSYIGAVTPTTEIPPQATRVVAKYDLSAIASGNQQVRHSLQVSVAGGSYVELDSVGRHNSGIAALNLGGCAQGEVSFPAGASLAFRLYLTVAGGGFDVTVGTVNLSLTYYS